MHRFPSAISPSTIRLELTSDDREYLRQLAPGITTSARGTTPSAHDRAEAARRAAARYLEARRAELREQLDRP